ncbi:SHOCT domain-containing protein [Salmonella enterica]|nr:SHOCT domain-containing protein [Salmonella enterica]
MSKIERLAEMKEEGILTEEEFQQQKQRILNG